MCATSICDFGPLDLRTFGPPDLLTSGPPDPQPFEPLDLWTFGADAAFLPTFIADDTLSSLADLIFLNQRMQQKRAQYSMMRIVLVPWTISPAPTRCIEQSPLLVSQLYVYKYGSTLL